MPTYEYRCSNCGQITEAFQKMSDTPLTTCPHCGKATLVRIVSGGAGVIYKGEGWYVTDYSHKSTGGKEPPPAKPSEPAKSGSDTKSGSETSAPKSPAKTDSPKPSAKKDSKSE